RAHVVEAARRHEPAAPRLAPVSCLGTALAGGRDPGEREAAVPGGADVEAALGMDAQLDAPVDPHVDRRPPRDEGDLVDVTDPPGRDHREGARPGRSTVNSTSSA